MTVLTEAADPFCLRPGESETLLAGHPWRRFAVLGDSIAEGVADAVPGYSAMPFADRVAAELAAVRPELAYLNLGERGLRAHEVCAGQLAPALAFAPDLALVACGANDALRPGYETRADAVDADLGAIIRALQEHGALVLTVSIFVRPAYPSLPAWLRPTGTERMAALGARTTALAAAMGTVHIDLAHHPIATAMDSTSADGLHGNARAQSVAAAEAIRALGRTLLHHQRPPAPPRPSAQTIPAAEKTQGGPMPLDPQIQAMRERRVQAAAPQLYTLSLAEARAADLAAIRAEARDPEPVHSVVDQAVPAAGRDIPVRVYRPGADPVLPTLLYFFGGGWTLGSLDTADGICRALANLAHVQVVSVGYRLAPEHRFPAAVEDCRDVLRHLAAHPGDFGTAADRLAVGGDSAGGNLAAVTALLARDDHIALAGQLLVYPNTDQLADDASMRDNTDPWLFNHRSVSWYRTHYLADEADAANPLASPLRAPDLADLPPALVITAEHDPLRDQGEAYARRLAAAGVHVELTRYEGMVHGFFTMTGAVDAAGHAVAQAASALQKWLS